jgi:RNA polymerase sigma factor (sigma-70 family)
MSEDATNHQRNQQHRPYWEKACEDSKKTLHTYAFKLANGRIYDVEDLVQETYCHALTSSGNPAKIKNPLAYLLRIMHNIWVDKWKKENTANMESLNGLRSSEAEEGGRAKAVEPAIESDVLRILENKELQAEMRRKQGTLTPRETYLLELHLKKYKCKDIATMLGEDVRLVRSDLNAVRAKVRYRLKPVKAKAKTTA